MSKKHFSNPGRKAHVSVAVAKNKPDTNSDLPKKDQEIARHRSMEIEEQGKLIEEINRSIGEYRGRIGTFAKEGLSIARDARRIGMLILKHWELLPGKTMTFDFWQKFQDDFPGVSLEMLKWFVRVAQGPEITTFQEALSCRKQLLLCSGDFKLEGEAPGSNAHEPPNFYTKLMSCLDPKTLQCNLQNLAKDSNFGDIAVWPQERKDKLKLQLEPYKQLIEQIWAKVNESVIETN